MAEVPLKWTSRVVAHHTFEEALSAMKRPNTKVLYGLDEAKMLVLNESNVEEDSKTHFYVIGDAIHATTTQNLHKYLAEELEDAAETLAGRPVMVDHGKGSLDNAGKVLVTSWEGRGIMEGAITYLARIRRSHPVAEAVEVGDIDTVSVGASAKLIECSICGKNMETCPHHIGRTYEVEGGGERLATAIGRGLKFRELSITPFPADEQASAYVATDSILDAMNVWVESSETKQPLHKLSGEKTRMSEDHKEEQAKPDERVLKENKELHEKASSLQNKNTELEEQIKRLKQNEVNSLVENVIETGIAANLYKSDDADNVRQDLRKLPAETLKEKLADYKRMSQLLGKTTEVKSTAVVHEREAVEQTPVKDPLIYSKEELKAGLREAMGNLRTSEYAQKMMRKIAFDAQNPNREIYLKTFTENTRHIRRSD